MQTSATIANLASALAKAQGEFPKVPFDGNNPTFKNRYATLGQLIEFSRPTLEKHGLCVIQSPITGEVNQPAVGIQTMILHNSGEFIILSPFLMKVSEPNKAQSWAQVIGSVITYGRRYGYAAALGLITDEDMDGNTAPPPRAATEESRIKWNSLVGEATTLKMTPRSGSFWMPEDNCSEALLRDEITKLQDAIAQKKKLIEQRKTEQKAQQNPPQQAQQPEAQQPDSHAQIVQQTYESNPGNLFNHVLGTPEYTRFLDTVKVRDLRWETEGDVSVFQNAMTNKVGNIYIAAEMTANDFGEVTILVANEEVKW